MTAILLYLRNWQGCCNYSIRATIITAQWRALKTYFNPPTRPNLNVVCKFYGSAHKICHHKRKKQDECGFFEHNNMNLALQCYSFSPNAEECVVYIPPTRGRTTANPKDVDENMLPVSGKITQLSQMVL